MKKITQEEFEKTYTLMVNPKDHNGCIEGHLFEKLEDGGELTAKAILEDRLLSVIEYYPEDADEFDEPILMYRSGLHKTPHGYLVTNEPIFEPFEVEIQ